MRVISGTARGRKLKEPANYDIRPTTDKVKESMFNIIQFNLLNSRVLDMFAGTGQLGLEAISRGASEAVFIDMSSQSNRIIKENIQICGAAEQSTVIKGDSVSTIETLGQFDIIFIDPPYDSELVQKALNKIIEFDILKENGIILCEMRYEHNIPFVNEPYFMKREYKYGKIRLVVFSKKDGSI